MGAAEPNSHSSPNGQAPRRGAKTRVGSTATPNSGALQFTIPSNFDAGREVQQRIMEDVNRSGYNTHCIFAINLALEEALINAIKHGNGLDPLKKVWIAAVLTPSRAEITVEDEGCGFDRTCVPDPTAHENLEKCSGRGILLIESYMTSVEWSRGGRRLRMIKDNEPDPLPRRK